jgi:hypothetical protein
MAESFKPLKGMLKDTGRMDQVDGTYRDALNLIVDDLKLNVANEYGTISVAGLNVFLLSSTNTVINVPIAVIGQIALLDDNFIVFGCGEYYDTTGILVKVSAIFKIDVSKRIAFRLYYTTDVQTTSPGTVNPLGHLNFDVDHPVTAELRESPTQEEIVYFTDNKSTFATDPSTGIEYVSEYNPPRVFNVSKQEESVDITGDPTNLYGTFKRVEFLNLFMDSGPIPKFLNIKILKGGGVITGAYYLGVAYSDDDRTETNVLTVSNPVYIVPANDDSFPREMISGAPNGTQTDKSIQWILSGLNQEYKYIVPYIVQYSGKSQFVYKLENVNITGPIVNVVYSGLEKAAASDIKEAVIDKVRYLTAKSITQLDNKLYAANLTGRPDLGFQRFANNIKIEPVVELLSPFDPRRYDVYTLNEGYAQLVYPDPPGVYNTLVSTVDGTYTTTGPMGAMTSNVSHIQYKGIDAVSEAYVTSVIIPIQQGTSAGYRDPNLLFSKKGYRRGEVYSFYISFILKDGSETYAYHIPGRDKVAAFEDDWTAFETGVGSNLGAIGFGIKTGEIKSYDPNSRVYQYFDTSYMGTVPTVSNMGYWKNLNEIYPNNENFEVWDVDASGQSVYRSTLVNTNVRHHKMPSNHNAAYSHIVRDTYFGNVPLGASTYGSGLDGEVIFREQVRILGIKLHNLKIPKFILTQVQGYKVYYAKRTQGNKTIIGQSGAHPATLYPAANLSNSRENAKNGPFFNIWALDGDLKYGGLAISDALWTQNPEALRDSGFVYEMRNFDDDTPQVNYIGNPVFKFHDFNLLRKRPTISTATHIDIQYICLMENWRGGYKGAQRTPIPEATGGDAYNAYYRSFRSGIGDDTFSWLHEDLGNMLDFSVPADHPLYYDIAGPKVLWGNVYIASRYAMPGGFNDSDGQRYDQGITWYEKGTNVERYLGDFNEFPSIAIGQQTVLSNTQTILMLEPEGATYANGLSIIKSATANGFKGATYLYNAFGESCIAISLASGLPMLGGYRTNEWSYVGLSNLIWSLKIYPQFNWTTGNTTDIITSPGSSYSLIGGHDINFKRPNIVDGVAAANNNVYWYQVENIFVTTLMSGHGHLRRPYNLTSPPVSSGTGTSTVQFTARLAIAPNIMEIESVVFGSLYDIPVGAPISVEGVGSGTVTGVTITSNVGGYIQTSFVITTSNERTCVVTINGESGSILQENVNNDPRSRPNTYLVNLCSNKTDVFEPFDKQELVWTGFYRDLSSIDLDTGEAITDGYTDVYVIDPPDPVIPDTTSYFVPNPACDGDWVTFYTPFDPAALYTTAADVYWGDTAGGPYIISNNPFTPATPGAICSIDLQLQSGSPILPPGTYPISFYNGSGVKIGVSQYVTIGDCGTFTGPGGAPSIFPTVNLYTTGDTVNIFGGDTYICRYSYRTTSNLYGLGRFKKGVNAYNINRGSVLNFDAEKNSQQLFGDIPIDLNTGKSPSFLANIYDIAADYKVLWFGGQADSAGTSAIEGAGNEFRGARRNSINENLNWSTLGYEVFTTLYQYIVESDDNINYRHAGDPEAGVSELNSMYFDRYVAADVLYRSPLGDLTKMDNMLYEDHYSALQDIRVPIAFPKETTNTLAYPNRVIRSSTQDGNFNDTYRYFLGIQYKDFAVNKGQITNIFNLKALLYIHTEKSLFRTKGKQNIELGDSTQAYIGSGDLFAQEPDEFIQSIEGYNGLYNKMGSLVTKDGYIFVARKSRKIFLVKDNEVVDLTQLGINTWARENIPFALEAYGWDPDYLGVPSDAPTGDFGFLVSYDPLFKRTLITKKELVPTQALINGIDQGIIVYDRVNGQFKHSSFIGLNYPVEEGSLFERGGWTISFSNSLSVWASRHSYIPALYAFNSKYMYSFNNILSSPTGLPASTMYEHSDFNNPGNFYGTVYSFEIDCIFTAPVNAVYSGFKYTADVFNKTNARLAVEQQFSPGFTSFYVYNTTQISGEVDFVYLNNIRKTDNTWNVNAFRDLSKIASNNGLAVGQINVQGVSYTNTSAPTSVEPMFLTEGIINSNYIDSNKPWYEQRKFVDKFLGIRLIANNLSKNLINLYTVTVALRVSPR